MSIKTKLSGVEETIFSKISFQAQKFQAINLGQGFPNFSGDSDLIKSITKYIEQGYNQYAPMPGLLSLREEISRYFNKKYQLVLDPESEITITSGATEGLTASILSLIHLDDEVIIFDPSYDSYGPTVSLAGGRPIHLHLDNKFKIPLEKLKQSISNKTKMIIFNSPHNPTGEIISKEEWLEIQSIVKNKDIFILSDEVYEAIIFHPNKHFSPLQLPDLKDKVISTYSFGKTCHMTGWKIGYTLSSKEISKEIRKIHQYLTFSTFTAAQYALSDYLKNNFEKFEQLHLLYEEKKNVFIKEMEGSLFKLYPAQGTYFIMADYSKISKISDFNFCLELIKKYKVAAIPLSSFYKNPIEEQKIIRLCFAKKESTLLESSKILREIKKI